jgi:hypothetical protein
MGATLPFWRGCCVTALCGIRVRTMPALWRALVRGVGPFGRGSNSAAYLVRRLKRDHPDARAKFRRALRAETMAGLDAADRAKVRPHHRPSATITYGRPLVEWAEHVCAENTQWFPGQEAAVPTANNPDF